MPCFRLRISHLPPIESYVSLHGTVADGFFPQFSGRDSSFLKRSATFGVSRSSKA